MNPTMTSGNAGSRGPCARPLLQLPPASTRTIPLRALGLAGILTILTGTLPDAYGAVSFSDIRIWAGEAPGPGISEAALVIDWGGGSTPYVWGYRWNASQRRTGLDMVKSIIGADPRLSVQGLASGFLDGFGWDADLDGTPERFGIYNDNGTPGDFNDDPLWNYNVNNQVYFDPVDFTLNSHIVPPATTVVPLGNPYAPGNAAPWISSSTGSSDRELANGSWDGWGFGVFGTVPLEPDAASVPEASVPGLLLAAGAGCLMIRRRATTSL